MPKVWAFLERVVLILIAALICLYAGDFVSLKLQIPQRPQTRDIPINPLLAVPEKGGKTEFILAAPQIQTCSTSLFPQLGYQPCWYVMRHKDPRVDI